MPIRWPILVPLLLTIWITIQRVRRYRAERATTGWTPALRAERWMFRGLSWFALWVIFAVAAMSNPNTPDWLMTGIWCGAGIGLAVGMGAAFVSGVARARERYERAD